MSLEIPRPHAAHRRRGEGRLRPPGRREVSRTVALPDYRATPGNQGADALRGIDDKTAHFLMVTFWESEEAIRALYSGA
jgi:heme-degrading monooxygenase HmoA